MPRGRHRWERLSHGVGANRRLAGQETGQLLKTFKAFLNIRGTSKGGYRGYIGVDRV